MMNDKAFEKRINRDLDRTKKDLAVLKEDAVSGLSKKFGKIADESRKSATSAAVNLNKSVTRGLDQYNTKVQGLVDNVPGDLNKKIAGYPWVAITTSIVLGLLLGALLKPGRPQLQ